MQQTLTWTVVHDKVSSTIFRRDGSGDHVLLSQYRERVSIPKDAPGNVSLLILNLEVSDRGTYTCQVTWKDSNNSLIAKEIATKLEVVKGKSKKEAVQEGKAWLRKAFGNWREQGGSDHMFPCRSILLISVSLQQEAANRSERNSAPDTAPCSWRRTCGSSITSSSLALSVANGSMFPRGMQQ